MPYIVAMEAKELYHEETESAIELSMPDTTFPRNLADFNSKALYHAATIRGWLDFEGGVYRDQHARTYTGSIISLFVYARIMRMCILLSSPYHAVRF